MNNSFTFASTIHYFDALWGPKNRMGVVIKDNGNGTLIIARTTTKPARLNQQPAKGARRLQPDGQGQGNSLTQVCDLTATQWGITTVKIADIIADPYTGDLVRGHLGKADAWWLEDQI